MRLQVVYTELLESPRFFWKKALNSIQGKRALTAWLQRYASVGDIEIFFALLAKVVTLYIGLLIMEIGKSSLQLAFSMVYRFWSTALTLKKQIYAEFCDLL